MLRIYSNPDPHGVEILSRNVYMLNIQTEEQPELDVKNKYIDNNLKEKVI
jgi:hypothetical protein